MASAIILCFFLVDSLGNIIFASSYSAIIVICVYRDTFKYMKWNYDKTSGCFSLQEDGSKYLDVINSSGGIQLCTWECDGTIDKIRNTA